MKRVEHPKRLNVLAGLFLSLTILSGSQASAQAVEETVRENDMVRVNNARSEIANQIHLQAYDLIDQMVYEWGSNPIFEKPTSVVVAAVNAPLGLGSGLMALLENHLYAVVLANLRTNIRLVQCGACTEILVHSGKEGTVLSRGIDQPSVLRDHLPSLPDFALYLDLEAEGASLVLRVRITKVEGARPIVWAKAYTPTIGSSALLRSPSPLISAEDARNEYLAVLRGQGPIAIPLKVTLHTFASGENNTINPPLLMIQSGIEVTPTFARAWAASFTGGIMYLPDTYIGLHGQARIYRLISGNYRSLTGPDVYLFVGADITTVSGESIASLTPGETSLTDLFTAANPALKPRATFGGFQLGLEVRVNNKIGLTVGLKSIPSLRDSAALGDFLRTAFIDFQSLSTEVAFWY